MSDDDPPLLIYQQTADHLLLNPRPGPRHALRVDLYPRRPSDVMTAPEQDDLTATDHLVENTAKEAPADGTGVASQDPDDVPVSVVDETGRPA